MRWRALFVVIAGCARAESPDGPAAPTEDAPAPTSSAQADARGDPTPPAHAATARAATAPPHAATASAHAAHERACTRDEDCAVATIETAGDAMCCASCATTPGTRAWLVELERRCRGATGARCSPLACPRGPTHPVCRAGQCEAVVGP